MYDSFKHILFFLSVKPEIQFLGPAPLLTVNQSDPAVFECNATGIPAPFLQWSMGDIELNNMGFGGGIDDRISITESTETYLSSDGFVFSVTSILTIISTDRNDSGSYSCTAYNRVGDSMTPFEDEESTNLFVQGIYLCLYFNVCFYVLLLCLSYTVPPLVVAVEPRVIGYENMDVTLQFRIDNAVPSVMLSNLQWFYSEGNTTVDITNETNRTLLSQLMTSFSSDGVYFNITVVNIVQRRTDGEETDEGQYTLKATNPAGVSMDSIYLEVYGKLHCKHLQYSLPCFLQDNHALIRDPEMILS